MAVRLKDIAAELGVSPITVSKVLRNKPDVGEVTRKRVLQRVEELNYRPNLLARGLASGRSQTIGLIVPDLVHTFFAELAKSLKAELRKRGYQLVLASAEEEPELEREEIENLLARGVDAILIASCQSSASGLDMLINSARPYVLMDRTLPNLLSHFVGTDDVAAGYVATQHLLSLGRQRIAHIAGEGVSTGADRFLGYKNALTAAGVPLKRDLVFSGLRTEESGDELGRVAMHSLLKLRKHPDAVFCYNDLTAVGAIGFILGSGLRVPEDVAVIGCGNTRLATYLEVPLSSVDQLTQDQGEQAAELIISLLAASTSNHGRFTRREIRLKPKVVARASTIGKQIL